MAKPLSILYVSSEVFPFAKVGGIGDVAYSLPIAVREEGHDIRVMMPKYGIVSERRNKIHEINRLREMDIPIGNNMYISTVKSSSINNPRTKVQAYITTNQNYFDMRKGIYSDIKTGKDFPDNDERFTLFSKTVIETCSQLGWFPDIIHTNDWQTGMIAAFARILYPKKFAKTKFILTIHNMSHQGEYPAENFDKLLLPEEVKQNFIHKGNLNFLKAGIIYADAINTVSKTYCSDILQDVKHTNGLNDILIENSTKVCGIINGIDTYGWNPANDALLHKKLGKSIYEYKKANKEYLLKQFGLQEDVKIPLIGIVTKLIEQKGIDILAEAIPKLLKNKMYIILIGDGESKYKDKLKEVYKNHFDNFAYKIGFDEAMTHNLEAGCDFYLAPSQYEPCGLNIMYSLKYGTIPIVRATGGLNELVEQYNPETMEGNGFKFNDFSSAALISTVKEAIKIYKKKTEWNALVEKVMKSEFSWKDSVKEYINMYYNTIKD